MLEGLMQDDYQLTLLHVLERMRGMSGHKEVVTLGVCGGGDCRGKAGSLQNAIRYEDLIAGHEPGYDYPELDERTAAGLCYTSGTTGNPKGVLYSHRSNVLHCIATCMADTIGMTSSDR